MKSKSNDIKKLLILSSPFARSLGLFEDITKRHDVEIHYAHRKVCPFPISIIQRIFLGSFVNRYVEMPFKHCWYQQDSLCLDLYSQILVFADMDLTAWIPFLKKAKKKGIRIDAFLFDSINAKTEVIISMKRIILRKKFNFDNIYSYDPFDADRYGFKHIGYCYYSKHSVVPLSTKRHLYFVGSISDDEREDIIREIHDFLLRFDVQFQFNVAGRFLKGAHINNIPHWLGYNDVLKNINESQCILEVIKDNQHAPSLRYFEAVCYNKKLLTNNPNIENLPYYNSRYMRIFRTYADIDVEWLKEDIIIDYGYKGDFSPNILVDKLLRE